MNISANIERAANPRSVVEADTDVALQVRGAQGDHAARKRDDSGAHDHAQNAEQRTLRKIGGTGGDQGVRNLR